MDPGLRILPAANNATAKRQAVAVRGIPVFGRSKLLIAVEKCPISPSRTITRCASVNFDVRRRF